MLTALLCLLFFEAPMTHRHYGLTKADVRRIAHRHTVCLCEDKPGVLINHTNLCDGIRAAIREALLLTQTRAQRRARRRKA